MKIINLSLSAYSTQEPKIIVAQDFHLSGYITSRRLSRSSVLGLRECALIWLALCENGSLPCVERASAPYKLGLQVILQCCPLLRPFLFLSLCALTMSLFLRSLHPQSGGNEYI